MLQACAQWLDKLFVALHADLTQLAKFKLDIAMSKMDRGGGSTGLKRWVYAGLLALRLGDVGFAQVCFESVPSAAEKGVPSGSYYFAKLLLVKQYIDGNELVLAWILMHQLHVVSATTGNPLQSAILMNRTRQLIVLAMSVHGSGNVKEAGKVRF